FRRRAEGSRAHRVALHPVSESEFRKVALCSPWAAVHGADLPAMIVQGQRHLAAKAAGGTKDKGGGSHLFLSPVSGLLFRRGESGPGRDKHELPNCVSILYDFV